MACPQGAHYLPLPGPQAREVSDWLHEIGLLRSTLGRTVADERHLCHSPQERLFIDGAWAEGLLPPADAGSRTLAQYQNFAAAVTQAQALGFALPSTRAPWTPAHAALDATTFTAWLAAQGLDDAHLRWYLDYCCRDDYGAGIDAVSAWAGLHYFASRHGFHAPGDAPADGEREPVFTWPEGNAWLVQRLAAPLAARLHTARTVLQVEEQRRGVQVQAWDERQQQLEQWQADTVVLAVPLFVAARLLAAPPPALAAAVRQLQHAPWLVANVHLDRPLLDRPGAPPSWDNVVYGSSALGYVDAMHQSLRAAPGPTVLTCYRSLLPAQRPALLAGDATAWAQQVLADLAAVHPDLPAKAGQVDLARWGHGMAIPAPGVRGSPALAALRAQRGRVRFAHSDLCGSSVFEEAFTVGHLAAA
jgi:monoamine oxidase